MLSNILLDDLDQELERRGPRFVRYADDFLVFVNSARSAERVFSSVERYLTRHLKLVVNQQKSSVRPGYRDFGSSHGSVVLMPGSDGEISPVAVSK